MTSLEEDIRYWQNEMNYQERQVCNVWQYRSSTELLNALAKATLLLLERNSIPEGARTEASQSQANTNAANANANR